MVGAKRVSHPQSSTRGHWADLDNEQLLEAQFFNESPEHLPRLLERMPLGEELPHIEFTYDTRGGAMVRCRHCKPNAANHHRGFVLRYENGDRVLVGKDCGAKQFGESFNIRKNEFSAASKRAELLKRREHIIRHRRRALQIIETIEGYDGWGAYARSKKSFRHGLWQIVGALQEAVQRRDGVLYITDRVRDLAAEQKRTRSGPPIMKEVEVPVGTLAGQSFFTSSGELPDRQVTALMGRLKSAIFNSIGEADRDHDLKMLFKGIDNLIDALDHQLELVIDLSLAAAPPNLQLLCNWMHGRGMGHYRVQDTTLYRHDAANQVVSVQRGEGKYPVRFEISLPESAPPKKELHELRSCLRR